MIQTDAYTQRIRARMLDPTRRAVLIAHLGTSTEATDRYTRINCRGFGRVREFKDYLLHLEKAARPNVDAKPLLRGGSVSDGRLRTQVFQLAGCNWRCWYCFVDDNLLSADRRVASLLSVDDLLDLYLAEADRPSVIDLSGGQPDIVPEWGYWMLQAIEERGLRGVVSVWTDDNLSTFLLWDCITSEGRRYMAHFPGYTRVGCFKGFDEASFTFNTRAHPELFDRQFEIMRRLINDGFNMYAYATFTADPTPGLQSAIRRFVDRLQSIDPRLPLRTVPLKIHPFAASRARMEPRHVDALAVQHEVYACWTAELSRRFTPEELEQPYDDIRLLVATRGS
jgi:uncharacterized Fe-S cluster-containing radical SAM superfamily protein